MASPNNVDDPKTPTPLFAVGAHVKHAAAGNGKYPVGTGLIQSAIPYNCGKGCVYTVKCDRTDRPLPFVFEESELSPV